jgi:uncharacterized protein YllA (UPF0747 family)
MNPHWRVQYHQTCQDTIAYDFIGRVERLESDLRKIGKSIGADIEAFYSPETRHNTNAAARRAEFLTPRIREKIRSKYEIDFKYFSYDD